MAGEEIRNPDEPFARIDVERTKELIAEGEHGVVEAELADARIPEGLSQTQHILQNVRRRSGAGGDDKLAQAHPNPPPTSWCR